MRFESKIVPSLFVIVATGCATSFSSSGRTYPPRPEGCEFEVFSVPPASGYEQVGTLDIPPGYAGSNWPRTISGLRDKVAPDVCSAGGDAVFASPNGFGAYVNATILKRTAALSPPPSPPAPAAEADEGCHFDAQCKGNRVCVKHECVDPAQ